MLPEACRDRRRAASARFRRWRGCLQPGLLDVLATEDLQSPHVGLDMLGAQRNVLLGKGKVALDHRSDHVRTSATFRAHVGEAALAIAEQVDV